MREPPVKKILYWCDQCNVPLIGRGCACGKDGRKIQLLQPYDVRPALAADAALINNLVRERFGTIPLNRILLLNKTGGIDRADLVIMNGERFGWLTFDPVARKFNLDIAPEARDPGHHRSRTAHRCQQGERKDRGQEIIVKNPGA
jgi:cysteine desulfurase / selenocysteine lyase